MPVQSLQDGGGIEILFLKRVQNIICLTNIHIHCAGLYTHDSSRGTWHNHEVKEVSEDDYKVRCSDDRHHESVFSDLQKNLESHPPS